MNKKRWLPILAAVVIVLVLGVTVTSRKGEPADSTPTPTLSVAVGETGPRIVKQSPIAGQRLSLLPTVDLTFDRDMDPDSTGIAWSMTDSTGADVPGKITWPDERTLRFIPLAPLQPAADYAGVITTAAFALDGSTPGADIYLSFRTVDALAVGEIFPADGTKDVDVESTIAVIFNRPVVTLSGTEDAGTLANPIRIVPAIAGHGEWVNTSVFIYTPDTSLISGTTYRVTVDAGLTDFTGEALAETFISNFTTRVPKISGVSLKDRQKNPVTDFDHALLDQAFMVSFLQPMNVESVAQALSLTEEKTGLAFPYQLSWNDKKTILTITPAGRYKPEESYHLFLAEWIAEAEGGVPLSEGLDFLFHTVPLPRILGVTPSPNSTAAKFNSGLRIQFSTPMDFNSLKGRVVITPAPAEPLRWAYDSGNWIYSANGLEPGTQYEVRVLPGMRDIYGHIMTEGYSYSFRTADLNPYAMMLFPSAPLIYRADGPQKYFFFEYINLESSRISLYPLSLAEFFAVGIFEGPQKDILPSADPIRTWSPDLKAKKNTLARLKIPLQDDADQPLAPGYYYIGLNAEPFTEETRFHQGAVFVVATDNITFKASGNDALAWVTDLETGTPSGGIDLVLYDKDFKVIGRATTNADGLASWTGVADPFFVAAESGGHLAFASQAWGSGISQNEVGVWQLYFRDPESLYSFVYTDRPLYRPGQEVQFTGVVRSEDDLHYALPSVDAVFVSVIYEGEQIFKETLPLSEIGSFTGSYALGDDIPRGSYRIVIMDKPEGSIIGSVAFRVADYRKPEFQVGVTADTADISPGGKVVFDIRADYFSGGKVGNAAVDWFVEYTPYFFTPPSAFRGFSFIDWDMESGRRAAGGGGTVASGKGVMDSDGNFELPQTMSPGKTKGDWLVSFHANVTDVTGNLVSGGAQIVMHQSLVYAGIRATSYIGRAGEEQAFDLVVLDWEGQPVVGQTVSVQIVKRNWFSVQQMDEKGQLRWVTSVKETPVASFANVVMDADGRARASFIPNSGGVYKALVTVRDAKGNTHQASAYIWAAGDEYVPWQMTNDRSFQLVADKDSYEPGETAEILLAQPFEGEVYALVTYERGHIYHSEVVKLQGNSTVYRLPITADMAPAAYLSVVVIAGAQDRGTPDFRMGIVRINVNTTHQTLDVTVTADRETAGPGDTVTYTVETRDAAGNPLPAEVSWSLVDKAVLALTPSNVGPIVNAFYPLRALSVRTSLGIVWNAENFLASYKETSPTGESSGGGGDEGKGAGDLGVVSVRQDFKDTAFFRAETMTGADGKAQVTVTLPQNLTTWVMTVRAVTADSRVGEAVHELISSKPLFIALQTPRFFVAGDSARLGAGVHNNSDAAIKVVVSLQAAGVEIHSPIRQEVTVPGGQTAYVSWDVSVRPGAERVDLTARAEGGGFSDTSKPAAGTLSDQGIPVKRYTVRETVGTSGLLTDANSVTEGFSPPAEADHTELVVEVAPSLAASWASALSYLVDDPHCSMEQTVSRFLPNLLARRVLQSTPSASPALQADLDREVNSALQKIYAAQSYDGGWGWWSGWDSDPETSAYVMLGLIEAEKSGYAVSKTVLENGLDYLHRAFAGEVSANPDQQFTPQAFLLYVITRAGGRENDNPLYQYRYTLGVYEKAFFMMAMHEGNPGDPRIDTLLSDLESSATLSAAGIHWEEKTTAFRGWNTDRRTTAIVLQSMIQVDPGNPLNAMGVRWLMAGRSFGRWGSTQETAWSIMALAKWVETSRELEANYNYAIGLNGELWKDGVFDRFTISDPLRLTTPLESLYGKDGESLVLARGAGAGNLYYTAYMNISLPVAGVEALDHGIIIQREYFTLDNGMHPITAIGRGELVRVRLTIVASSSLRYVVVDDPLPAGLEAIDASLSGSVAVPRVYTVRDFRETGWGWWYFNHKEVRDDGVFLSASYLPAGTFVYTYLARASFAGTFNVIPATAEEFYFPDVSGHNAGSVFTVTP
jgi:alpha-2-macroglobulin